MAVEPVTNSPTPTPTPTLPTSDGGRLAILEDKLKTMTAKEIMDGYNNQNWDVPENILTWAQQEVQSNPSSTVTWGEFSKNNSDVPSAGDSDNVQYDEFGLNDLSLKEQCKKMRDLASQAEEEDLKNVTDMAPFTKEVPDDELGGNNAESAVSQALKDISKDMLKNGVWGKNFREGIKFFDALKKGASDETEGYNVSLEEMQSILQNSADHADNSKKIGEKAVEVSKEFRSSFKAFLGIGKKASLARKTKAQGEKTVEMAERTDKLAQAIAQDNNIALKSVQQNVKNIDEAEDPQDNASGSANPTPPPSPPSG